MKPGEHQDLTIPFGKFKDQLIADIEYSYLQFLLDQEWFWVKFPEHVKQIKIEIQYRKEWGR